MNLSQLKLEAIRIIKAKPEIKSEITELYFLAESEIEEGGSVEHECSLAYNDMIAMEKGTNDFARGGKTSSATMPKNVFDVLSKNIAESYVGKKVKPKFQSEYGKTYSAQEASEVGDKVAAKIFRQRKNKMAEGGEIREGFTISEMRESLKRLFPYSIGFSVGTFSKEGQQNINRSALITNQDDPLRGLNDTDLKSKLFFPQYKRDHEILFRIYQGGENTYFYFLLDDENGDGYIGQFAFKDRGDVPSSYITGFIAFLMEQYGLPFSVNHSVMADGGAIPQGYHQMPDGSIMADSAHMAKGGRVYVDFLGTKSKENWGKENLYPKYDNTLDLFADVSDYFKELAKENIKFAIEQKNELISILKNGKLNYNDGATLSFAKGGQIKVGDKFGSYSVTQYQPIRYDDSGGSSDGVVKLVNQKDFDTLFILYDNALRGGKWFIRKGGIQYTGKSPKEVFEKFGIKNLSIDGRMAQGGITYQDLSLEKPSIVNETKIESERFKIDEVDLFRKSKKTFSGSPSITSAADAVKIFREFWDEQSLTIFESFNVMLLNQANKIIGLYQHSKGGVTGTVADPEMVVLSAVKSLAKGVIISHNHPSGNLKPSEADIVMTNKIKSALKLVDVRLLDSIIITENSYYSFADEGKMALGGMMAKGSIFSPTDDEGNLIYLKVGDKVIEYKKPNPYQPKREFGGIGEIMAIVGASAKVFYETSGYEEIIGLRDLKKVNDKFVKGGMMAKGGFIGSYKKPLEASDVPNFLNLTKNDGHRYSLWNKEVGITYAYQGKLYANDGQLSPKGKVLDLDKVMDFWKNNNVDTLMLEDEKLVILPQKQDKYNCFTTGYDGMKNRYGNQDDFTLQEAVDFCWYFDDVKKKYQSKQDLEKEISSTPYGKKNVIASHGNLFGVVVYKLSAQQYAKGGKIREFDDVLVISKNKLGMVEAIAGETYYISTPFGESFEATLDDLRKVKSFARGGANEHGIYQGDRVMDIYNNRLIVEDSNGDIIVIDLSIEPEAGRYYIQRITNENTVQSAQEFIDTIIIRKPVTTKGLYEILTLSLDDDLRNGLNRKTMVVSKGPKWTDKKFVSSARYSLVRGGFTISFFNDDENDSIDFGELISIVEQYKDSELPIIAQVPGVFPRKFVRNAGFDKLSQEFFIEVAGIYRPPQFAKGGSLRTQQSDLVEQSVNEQTLKQGTKLRYDKNNFVIDYVVDKEYKGSDGFPKYTLKVVKSNYPKKIKIGSTEEYESSELGGLMRNGVIKFIKNESVNEKMAMGGSLQGHGFEIGDLIVEDLGGYIKVTSEDGKDFFITLKTGDRETEAPLPFKHGGNVKHSDITRLASKTNEAGDEVVNLADFYEEGGNVPQVFDVPAQFLDAKGQRKNDRKTIRELTDFVLELPQTKEIYFNEELGDYTPSRKKLHAEIINKFKKEVVCINNDKPIAIFMGGSPASGKSSFLRKYSPFLLKEEILKIDADEIRAMLPEYEGWNACQTHLETKDIVNILLSNKNIGIPCDFDIIYDGTMNSVKSYIPLMDILRERGYKIFIVFMDNVPKDVIIKRALDRYKSSGRFVPLEVIEDFFSKGKTAFNQLKNDVDGYMLVDGSSQDYRIIEQGGIKLPRDRKYSKLGTKIKASEIPMSYKKGGLSKLY